MPDGAGFDDFNGMKRELLKHCDRMTESMVASLIACGLSRESEFSNQDDVEAVVKQAREHDYRFHALLKAFVNHRKFKRK